MNDLTPTREFPLPSVSPPESGPPANRPPGSVPPWYVIVAGLLLLTILGIVVTILVRDDGSQDPQGIAPTTTTPDPSQTTAATTSTSAPESTTASSTTAPTSTTSTVTSTTIVTTTSSTDTTPTTIDPELYRSAVWPWFESGVRYRDPVAAAEGFAEDLVGFDDPIYGTFQQGDARSGEVDVRPMPGGPVTVVFVRQLGDDDTWWVIGAATEEIVVDEPDALDTVSSPIRVAGKAVAFEGVIDLQLRADGSATPLVDDVITGGGIDMRPFDETFPFVPPAATAGTLLLTTASGDDGRIMSAAATRVLFG